MKRVNILQMLIAKGGLDSTEIDRLIDQVVDDTAPSEQFAGVLSILSERGESPEELADFAKSMRRRMKTVSVADTAIDLCGTGGDGHDTVNISTACMFIVAGAGVKVAKHGNRSASGRSGSADVLEALGAKLDYDVQTAIDDTSTTSVFMFAPQFHPAMKRIVPVRKALGIPTVFNLLGPLLNPAGVKYQVIGTPSRKKARIIAEAVAQLTNERVGVIYNDDGLDELSTTCVNTVFEVQGESIVEQTIDATQYGLARATIEQLKGGSPSENARIIIRLLHGELGSFRDIAILNAAYALLIVGKATDLAEGIELAKESIDSGSANRELQRFIASTGGKYGRND